MVGAAPLAPVAAGMAEAQRFASRAQRACSARAASFEQGAASCVGDRGARRARVRLERAGAEARVARGDREAGGVASELGVRRHLEGARVGVAGDLGDRRDAPLAERGGVDALAAARVARLRGVEQAAGVADERVVADGLERVADERVDAGVLLHAGVDGGERVDLLLEVARQRRRIDARLAAPPASIPSAFSTLAAGAAAGGPGGGLVLVAPAASADEEREEQRGPHHGGVQSQTASALS